MINFETKGQGKRLFINTGDSIEDLEIINSKFNYYSEDKKIDLRYCNSHDNGYMNEGDIVSPEEVNDIINNN